ncbi:response regulator [Clostridium sp. C2-6-12]|uniref:response regulator n=1 Tax=Clostridium sp. C2-6-12 TaxID=2698832 RepID=UPI00136A9E50|nr:response regulator [Clostridium sp. C2-6-12]
MNILIVDDEVDILNEINFYVKKYKVFDCIVTVTCTNPLKALEEADKLNFDVALLDIEMPVMNGLELAEKLFDISPDIKIAFITAYNSYATEAFDVNAIDYVLKPIREERLVRALDRLIGKSSINLQEKEERPKLAIYTLGKFVVKIGEDIVKWNRKKSAELFAYLLENREMPIHKEKLCDLLWPDLEPRKALVNLQSTIYSIRKVLREYDSREISIKYIGDNYLLCIKDVYIDTVEFENLLQQAIEKDDEILVNKALDIYKEDYLEEEGWLWTEPRKQELRKKYTIALGELNSNL